MPRPRSERRSPWPAIVLVVVLLLPALYVASIGPAWYMVTADVISFRTYHIAYTPIRWISGHSRGFHRSIKWWKDCWTADGYVEPNL